MATIPVSARSGSLKTVLPSIAKDFEAIKVGFIKLVKLKKEEGLIRSSDVSRQRQVSYKEKFSKVILNKIDPKKKTLAEHTKGFFSVLKSIAGVLGSVFLFLGAVGIGKMIMSSDAGKFLGKFLATVFSSLIDLVKSSVDIVKSLFQDNEVKSTFFKTVSSIFKLIGDGLLVGFQIFKTLISDREIVESILNTIKNVFSAVFASTVVLASIVAEVFSQNTESIRNGIVSVITKIIDVLVPLLDIGSGVFKDLVNNESFLGSLKNIVRGIGELLVSIWNVNYIDPNTGEEKSVAGEIVKTIAEIGVAYAAFLALKLKLIEAGAALGAKGGEGIIEPSIEEEPKRTPGVAGGRIPKGGGRKGPSLEKIAAARETKASKIDRLKYVLEKKWRQIGLLAEKFRYSKIGQSKIIDLTIRLLYRLGVKISETRLFFILSTLVAGVFTSGTGIGSIVGIAILAANLYFAYDIIMMLLENIDILNKDIEDEEKKSEDATKGTAPTQSQLNLEGSKIGAGYAEAAKPPTSKTPTPTSTPSMAPAPTAPSPVAQSAGVEEMKGKVIGAGTAAAATEATAALQAKMKKGDVSAKQHEAGTDILAQKLPGLIPGFNRFTAFDDAHHNKVSPGSKHTSGLALDFTVNGGSAEYAKAAEAVRKHLSSVGLNPGDVKVIDEMNNSQKGKTTGPHIHVQFQSKEAADKYRGLFPDMPLTAFAKDAAPKEGTPFTLPTPSATLAGVDQRKEEKQKSLASLMMDDLTGSLAMMDQITGGKLGLASNDMKSMLRGLEDEMNRGTNFFNNSINIATQNIKNDSGTPSTIQQTNQNILNTILNRQYA